MIESVPIWAMFIGSAWQPAGVRAGAKELLQEYLETRLNVVPARQLCNPNER